MTRQSNNGNIYKTYTTACVNGGSDSSGGKRDEFINVIDIGICTTREHGASPRESEPVALHLNPILNSLLDAELFMRNVVVPGEISALRPLERRLVLWGSRYEAEQEFLLGRAMPLSVLEHVAVELSPSLGVLTGRVLTQQHIARR